MAAGEGSSLIERGMPHPSGAFCGRMRRVFVLFAVLSVLATWPQAVRFNSIPDNVDAYFSLWRIGWISQQITEPRRLFHGNIFHPEPYTLAYSDAVLLEGAIAAPFVRAGVPLVYVYNALVLGSFVACGVGMFLLVRQLTGAALPAVLAGVVFAFAPYRFDHYFHLELLWAQWMPLALWMLHRTLDGGRIRDGLGVGAFIALQTLSCIYYGIFLCSALVAFSVPLLIGLAPALRRRVAIALVAGAVLVMAAVLPYMRPYQQVRDVLGERRGAEALLYGAGPRHYLAGMPENLLHGWLTGPLGRPEKRLLPGFVALVLGLIALWPPVTRTTIAYAFLLALAINLSFGPRGIGYEWLRDHVVVYRGLRVPSRFGHVALVGFAVLAAIGCVRLRAWLARRGYPSQASVATLLVLAFAEFLVRPLELIAVPTSAPAAYQWLRTQPAGVVAEFPMPTLSTLPLRDGEFQYLSTFHWRPMVNGYSGNYPDSYARLLLQVTAFPDDRAVAALAAAGVTYVLVHERYFGADSYRQIVERLRSRSQIERAGTFNDDAFEIAAYRLIR
jgi:hypothetical protein